MARSWILQCTFIAFIFAVVQSHDDGKDCPLVGKFELHTDLKNDEYEEYLKAMGFDESTRETMRSLKTVVLEISRKGDVWTYCVNSRMKPYNQSFEVGKEFDETLFDGRKIKSVVAIDEGKQTMTRTQKLDGFEATQLLEFNKDDLKGTFTAKGKSAVIEFKRIKQAVFQLLMGGR